MERTAARWLGFEWDARIVKSIEGHTATRATTAVIAINMRLAALGAKRVGLVTPYVAAIEGKIIANYAAIGIEVVAAERLDLTENTAYAAVSPERVGAMVRTVAATRPDTIVIMCTNLADASVAEPLGQDLGIPSWIPCGCNRAQLPDARDRLRLTGRVRTSSIVTDDGRPVAYAVQGTGSPHLLLIHGWCCHRGFWEQQAEVLGANATVVTIDLAGHGNSPSLPRIRPPRSRRWRAMSSGWRTRCHQKSSS